MSPPIDPETLARLEALERAATPGPWEYSHNGQLPGVSQPKPVLGDALRVLSCWHNDDALFVALLRTHARALLDAAASARELRAAYNTMNRWLDQANAERDALQAQLEQALADAQTQGTLYHGCCDAKDALQARVTALTVALAGVVEWLDSEPVRATFSMAGILSITHPHLAVPITPEFAEWADDRLRAARAALMAPAPEPAGPS